MDHIEKHVVFLQLNLSAVVIELYFSSQAEYNGTMFLQTYLIRRHPCDVLHHHQIVAAAYPICANSLMRLQILHIHDVLYLSFWLQSYQIIFDI